MVRWPSFRFGATCSGRLVSQADVHVRSRGQQLRTSGRAVPWRAEDPVSLGGRDFPLCANLAFPVVPGPPCAAVGGSRAALLDHGGSLHPKPLQSASAEGPTALLGGGSEYVHKGGAWAARGHPGEVGNPDDGHHYPQCPSVHSPMGVLHGARGLHCDRPRAPLRPVHHARRDSDGKARRRGARDGRRRRARRQDQDSRRESAARYRGRADVGGGRLYFARVGRRHAFGERAAGDRGRGGPHHRGHRSTGRWLATVFTLDL